MATDQQSTATSGPDKDFCKICPRPEREPENTAPATTLARTSLASPGRYAPRSAAAAACAISQGCPPQGPASKVDAPPARPCLPAAPPLRICWRGVRGRAGPAPARLPSGCRRPREGPAPARWSAGALRRGPPPRLSRLVLSLGPEGETTPHHLKPKTPTPPHQRERETTGLLKSKGLAGRPVPGRLPHPAVGLERRRYCSLRSPARRPGRAGQWRAALRASVGAGGLLCLPARPGPDGSGRATAAPPPPPTRTASPPQADRSAPARSAASSNRRSSPARQAQAHRPATSEPNSSSRIRRKRSASARRPRPPGRSATSAATASQGYLAAANREATETPASNSSPTSTSRSVSATPVCAPDRSDNANGGTPRSPGAHQTKRRGDQRRPPPFPGYADRLQPLILPARMPQGGVPANRTTPRHPGTHHEPAAATLHLAAAPGECSALPGPQGPPGQRRSCQPSVGRQLLPSTPSIPQVAPEILPPPPICQSCQPEGES